MIIENIKSPELSKEIIVYRLPILDRKIKYGTTLEVKEGEAAIIAVDGNIADVFYSGIHKLVYKNLPILSKINSWEENHKNNFSADVYYVNISTFKNIKWGNLNPITLRDHDFGMIRIRAFGNFSFKVGDAYIFMKEIFGTISKFSAENISNFLKSMVVSGFNDTLAESKIAALDLITYYDELAEKTISNLKHTFAANGLELIDLVIENISLPEYVEKIINRRRSLGILGEPLKNKEHSLLDPLTTPSGGDYPRPINNLVNCVNCKTLISKDAKFCPECGVSNEGSTKQCTKCNNIIAFNAKFCPDCGSKLFDKKEAIICKSCGRILEESDKFCPECGIPT